MQRFYIVLTLLFASYGFLAAEPVPDDAQRILQKRNSAVAKIDVGLNRELEKLKIAYTKRGEIDKAVAVANLINANHSGDLTLDPMVDTTWIFGDSNGKKANEFTFRSDGSVDCEHSYPDASWSRLDEHTILFAYGLKAYIAFRVSEKDPTIMAGHHSISGQARSLKHVK